jgi:hypothetical protein
VRPHSGVKTSEALLGDFRTDSRMLLLVAFALPLGVISAFVAKALLRLTAESRTSSFSSGSGRRWNA